MRRRLWVVLVMLALAPLAVRAQTPDDDGHKPKEDPGLPDPDSGPKEARFITLFPSLLIQAAELGIKTRIGKADMRQGNEFVFTPAINFRTRDLVFSDHWGINLTGHA